MEATQTPQGKPEAQPQTAVNPPPAKPPEPPPPTLNNLAAALARAQGSFRTVAKDRDVEVKNKDNDRTSYTFKYATLAAIWEVIRKPLSENGLAVVQLVTTLDRAVRVETKLLHVSGESISSSCVMPVLQATPQAVGSAISYGKRYALSAMLGVVSDEEDDDGAEAVGAHQAPRQAPQPRAAPRGSKRAEPAPTGDALTNELADLIASIAGAADHSQLEALKPRLEALPEAEKPKMRKAYGARLEAFKPADVPAPKPAGVVRHGTHKGKEIRGLDSATLAGVVDYFEKQIEAKPTAKWLPDAKLNLAEIKGELERRASAAAGEAPPREPGSDDGDDAMPPEAPADMPPPEPGA